MPEPSSMHVESHDSRPDAKRTLLADVIHSANRGVTAQTTATVSVAYLGRITYLQNSWFCPKKDKYPSQIPRPAKTRLSLGHYCGFCLHVPAPVVPALRSLVSRPLLCWMTRSAPVTLNLRTSAYASMKPKDELGISCENMTKASTLQNKPLFLTYRIAFMWHADCRGLRTFFRVRDGFTVQNCS